MNQITDQPARAALDKLKRISGDAEARRLAFVRERALLDERSPPKDARDEGREAGKLEALRQTAANLIQATTLDDAAIAAITGLRVDEIAGLRPGAEGDFQEILCKPALAAQSKGNTLPRNPSARSTDFSRHLGRPTSVRREGTHGRLKSPLRPNQSGLPDGPNTDADENHTSERSSHGRDDHQDPARHGFASP